MLINKSYKNVNERRIFFGCSMRACLKLTTCLIWAVCSHTRAHVKVLIGNICFSGESFSFLLFIWPYSIAFVCDQWKSHDTHFISVITNDRTTCE